jgi:hypothetical protein
MRCLSDCINAWKGEYIVHISEVSRERKDLSKDLTAPQTESLKLPGMVDIEISQDNQGLSWHLWRGGVDSCERFATYREISPHLRLIA